VVLDRWDHSLLVHIKSERTKASATLNPAKDPAQAALLNGFLFTQQAREFLITKVGFQRESLTKKLTVMVNSDLQDCNAHYRHGLMTFYSQSENCRNTAYDTVIFHEFAHYVDDLLGGVSNVALSEGMGDILATFVTGQPAIGQHLFKNNPSPMRSADNTSVFEPSAPTYTQAQAWSGFAWRARQSLIEKYGPEKGESLAQLFFLAPLESEAHDIPSAAAEVFARAAEGEEIETAPDFSILQRAALNHGLEWKSSNSNTSNL
jgi:hypothetical protein